MPGWGPFPAGRYRSPDASPDDVGYRTCVTTGALVTQFTGRDGNIGRTLRKKIAVREVARINRIGPEKIRCIDCSSPARATGYMRARSPGANALRTPRSIRGRRVVREAVAQTLTIILRSGP